jgi:hypothetical protein
MASENGVVLECSFDKELGIADEQELVLRRDVGGDEPEIGLVAEKGLGNEPPHAPDLIVDMGDISNG